MTESETQKNSKPDTVDVKNKNIELSEDSKQIVLWYDNELYGQDYSIYEVKDWMVKVWDHFWRSLSLYKAKRLCLVIAFIENYSVRMVYDRYLDLSEEDRTEFNSIRRELLSE